MEAVHKDADEQRSASLSAVKEVEEVREQLRTAQREYAEKVKSQEEEVTLSRQTIEQANQQMELLKVDIMKFQTTARSAHANYERELQLHAKAEHDLKTAEQELDTAKAALHAAEQQIAQLTAASIRHERALAEEKARYEETSAQAKEQMEGLRRTNDLLHGQVQSLGIQVNRLLEGRGINANANASTSASATASATGEISLDTGDSSAALSSSSAAASGAVTGDEVAHDTRVASTDASVSLRSMNIDPEEVAELRKTSVELREVVRYMKRERDLLEAKLSVSEGLSARQSAVLAAAQRALDEARAELKRELDKRTATRSEEEFSRLMSEVTQLNLVRESNAHLRHENEELARRLKSASDDLRKALDAAAPLEESVRKMKAEIAALQASNEQLLKDSSYWKDRLHQLVSRYNDVDPVEHR
jgi:nucleoprotein TPR